MACSAAKTTEIITKMKKFIFPILGMMLISSCSSVKRTSSSNNFDDAYFSPSDIDKSEVYGKLNPNMFSPRASSIASNNRSTRSYGQSYNDRMRNFGGSNFAPSFRPTLAVTPFNPYMGMGFGYNPYGMYPYGYNPYGYNPFGMNYGFDPYGYNYYNSNWCYWNQYYSPFNTFYWGNNSTGGNSGIGSTWGGNKNAPSGFAGTPQRRSTYNSTLPSSSQSSRTGFGGSGSTWTGSSSSQNDTYYRPSSSSNSGSSGGSYSRPSSSGPSQSTGGGQSGSSGRRR